MVPSYEVADEEDIQVTIHTDTLNESACVEHSIAAFKGRTIHTYHSEGAGGGHGKIYLFTNSIRVICTSCLKISYT